MFLVRRLQPLACLFLFAGMFSIVSSASAQEGKGEGKGERVRFSTVDGVELVGNFYAGNKRNAPTIMMLHALGEDSRKKNWVSLAETLNDKGYSVLTFDFRGHNQSQTIDPTLFWKYPRNASSIKGAPKKETLEFKDIVDKSYYPIFVNDIAAAKAFLDNRNDTGVCNTSSFMVLGAETGATLGALWLNSEWYRHAYTPANPLMGVAAKIAPTPEGKDTIAGIWLSPSSSLGGRTVTLSNLLDRPGRMYATPMAFIYSEDDAKGKAIAKACESKFKGAKKKDDKYRFTMAVPIPGGGKLGGAALLQKSLETEEDIVTYVQGVSEAKGNEWGEKDFRKSQYIWNTGTAQPVIAKPTGEKLLNFNTYESFLR